MNRFLVLLASLRCARAVSGVIRQLDANARVVDDLACPILMVTTSATYEEIASALCDSDARLAPAGRLDVEPVPMSCDSAA